MSKGAGSGRLLGVQKDKICESDRETSEEKIAGQPFTGQWREPCNLMGLVEIADRADLPR